MLTASVDMKAYMVRLLPVRIKIQKNNKGAINSRLAVSNIAAEVVINGPTFSTCRHKCLTRWKFIVSIFFRFITHASTKLVQKSMTFF